MTKQLPKLGVTSSVLGFGCMRLPTVDGKIDTPAATQMIDYAYANGVTYYDTAWPYHGGTSEAFLGGAISKYPRDSYTLATKCPVWLIEKEEDFAEIFAQQLKNLQTDYVDFYLLHALSAKRFEIVKKFGLYEKARQLQKEGKIKHLGFSFHDTNEVFFDILGAHDWDFCQIQYNYIDNVSTRANELYEAASQKGIPIIVMEPIRGGFLATLPDEMTGVLAEANPARSVASYAIKWVADKPNVSVVLSGMSDMHQTMENIVTLSEPEPLTATEMLAIDNVVQKMIAIDTVPCTGCAYCVPCPFGVYIPDIFKHYNNYQMFQNGELVKKAYTNFVPTENGPTACQECGACEAQCPQHIPIIERLKTAGAVLNSL